MCFRLLFVVEFRLFCLSTSFYLRGFIYYSLNSYIVYKLFRLFIESIIIDVNYLILKLLKIGKIKIAQLDCFPLHRSHSTCQIRQPKKLGKISRRHRLRNNLRSFLQTCWLHLRFVFSLNKQMLI